MSTDLVNRRIKAETEKFMLHRIDRIQMVVRDREAAAATYERLLGAIVARQDRSSYLDAQRTILAVGESEIELCEPDGRGRAAHFLEDRGEGLRTAGASSLDLDLEALSAHLDRLRVPTVRDGEQIYLEGSPRFGVPFVLSPHRERERTGPVSFLYEVTNTLVSDWHEAAAWYTRIFGLDPERFSPIKSQQFGYDGTLTLFDPPARLDRIELSQVTDPDSAMGRWVEKRGDSLYMCYVEVHDLEALLGRIREAGVRFTPRGDSRDEERDGLWLHPSALHGLLLGVSRTTLGWEWSGRPELVAPAP